MVRSEYAVIQIFAIAGFQGGAFDYFESASSVGLPFSPQENGVFHSLVINKLMSATAVPRPLDADVAAAMREIGAAARAAARVIANAPAEQKARALGHAADILRQRKSEILAANARDLAEAKGRGLSAAMIDRLTLDEKRIEAMAKGVEEVADSPIPSDACSRPTNAPTALLSSASRPRSA